jgi:hypothetical protein
MGMQGRLHVERHFRKELVVAETLDLYAAALRGAPRLGGGDAAPPEARGEEGA